MIYCWKPVVQRTFPLRSAYRQLRELLEHFCRTQIADSSLQMTDLSARINFVSSKARTGLSPSKIVCILSGLPQCRFEPSGRTFAGAIAARCQNIVFFVKRLTGEAVPAETVCTACCRMQMLRILLLPWQRNVYGACVS